jgi:hypothetical protein
MHLTLIKNPDESKIILYKIARIIYAETNASSLRAAEALASLIKNLCISSARQLEDIAKDATVFESLNKNSARHDDLLVDCNRAEFQMCLRVAQRMLSGALPDAARGAVRFHRADTMPGWATSIGSICEIDNLIFYL